MKLANAILVLPFALAMPAAHRSENIEITIDVSQPGPSVTDGYDTCIPVLFEPNHKCPDGWTNVPVMDGKRSTCCKNNAADASGINFLLSQAKAALPSFTTKKDYPVCDDKCPEGGCAEVCDIKTHECYNACVAARRGKAW